MVFHCSAVSLSINIRRFIYFLAPLGLHCYLQAFSSGEQELLFVLVHGLLIAMASLFAK